MHGHFLTQERKEFRHLAEGGSRVFFALKDLRKINPIYQFSLNSFLGLFRRALATSQVRCSRNFYKSDGAEFDVFRCFLT